MILIRSSHRDCLSGYGVVTSGEAFKTSGVGVVHFSVRWFPISLNISHNHSQTSTSRKNRNTDCVSHFWHQCRDQASEFDSGSKDSSPVVTNHYPEMTECGHNPNYGSIFTHLAEIRTYVPGLSELEGIEFSSITGKLSPETFKNVSET